MQLKPLAFALLLSACAHESSEHRAATRTNDLRAMFPPGKATRADVETRAGNAERSLERPSTGWTQPFIRDIEDRTGLVIARADKHVSPTGTSAGFFTLEHVWYFFDRADVLVDVVWERVGD